MFGVHRREWRWQHQEIHAGIHHASPHRASPVALVDPRAPRGLRAAEVAASALPRLVVLHQASQVQGAHPRVSQRALVAVRPPAVAAPPRAGLAPILEMIGAPRPVLTRGPLAARIAETIDVTTAVKVIVGELRRLAPHLRVDPVAPPQVTRVPDVRPRVIDAQ